MSAAVDLILSAKFFDSVYPGSMCARADGDFVHREDAVSLAGAFLALLHAREVELYDRTKALAAVTAERDQLSATHVPDFHELMAQHGISVWQDPEWRGGRYGTPRWLAGIDVHAEVGTYYSTLTGSGPASIEGKHIASGDSPSDAVWACVKVLPKAPTGSAA